MTSMDTPPATRFCRLQRNEFSLQFGGWIVLLD
jgi:hypothetical protein